MLDISACEVTPAKRNVDDAQVKRFIRSNPVKFMPWPLKNVEEARTAVVSAYGSSAGFMGSLGEVVVVEDEIAEE